jgi:hypothetical protein
MAEVCPAPEREYAAREILPARPSPEISVAALGGEDDGSPRGLDRYRPVLYPTLPPLCSNVEQQDA